MHSALRFLRLLAVSVILSAGCSCVCAQTEGHAHTVTREKAPPVLVADGLVSATRSFSIILQAPVAIATSYFGPIREREWAPAWAPSFVHPSVPAQEAGAVFWTTDGARGKALWVMTDYDVTVGKVGYVALIPDFAVTQIRIELAASGKDTSVARVIYRRTALATEANAYVDHDRRRIRSTVRARRDSQSGFSSSGTSSGGVGLSA
jgi:uncharacterized membrane protein YgcG